MIVVTSINVPSSSTPSTSGCLLIYLVFVEDKATEGMVGIGDESVFLAPIDC